MKNKELIALFVFILIISLFSAYFLPQVFSNAPYKTETYKVRVTVGSVVGINHSTDLLEFGEMPKYGGLGGRRIVFNGNEFSQRIILSATGQVVDYNWLSVSENNFILEPNETKKIRVQMYIPNGVPQGSYDGELQIDYYKI